MTRLAPLLLLLAACSSSGPDDAETLEDGSSGEVDPGGTGDDGLDEGGSSGGDESGESGEPAPAWPPACLDEGTCAGLEVAVSGECEWQGAELRTVEVVWSQQDESTGITAGCGEPLRTTVDEPGVFSVLVVVTWASDEGTWSCWTDDGGGGTEGPNASGETFVWERDLLTPSSGNEGGPPIGTQGGGCCLLSGTASEAFASTPCEES